MQTYDQLLCAFSSRAMELRFSYPGNEGCIISAENAIRFACDGTPIDTGRLIYRAGRGADTEQFFKSAFPFTISLSVEYGIPLSLDSL